MKCSVRLISDQGPRDSRRHVVEIRDLFAGLWQRWGVWLALRHGPIRDARTQANVVKVEGPSTLNGQRNGRIALSGCRCEERGQWPAGGSSLAWGQATMAQCQAVTSGECHAAIRIR
jgi:hypothetical protein